TPDIYFVLTASPDIIRQRKQELSTDEILDQNEKFHDINYDNVVHINVEKDIKEVAKIVHDRLISFLEVRMEKRCK
ncbi:hypothetical protein N9005_06470, partial [Akkermansiaceae bacterium]|nr:hypothetical protein [Akkermansiaceae bacterium]